jgi:hypothetical protein
MLQMEYWCQGYNPAREIKLPYRYSKTYVRFQNLLICDMLHYKSLNSFHKIKTEHSVNQACRQQRALDTLH